MVYSRFIQYVYIYIYTYIYIYIYIYNAKYIYIYNTKIYIPLDLEKLFDTYFENQDIVGSKHNWRLSMRRNYGKKELICV